MALATLWFSGMPFFLQDVRILAGSGFRTMSYHLVTWGNTLIAAATVLYVANPYLSVRPVGKWASRLAIAGSVVLVLDLAARLLGVVRVSGIIRQPYVDIYDVVSVIVPMAVIWYLVVEHASRSRAAGVLIMPVIVILIGVEMWLLAENAGSTQFLLIGLRDYWGQAYLVAHVVGYGAFVLAAITGVAYLARCHLEIQEERHPLATRFLPDSWTAQTRMLSGISVGVPVFALALVFATVWGLGAEKNWGSYSWFHGLWIVSVLAFYVAFLYVLHTRSMPGHRMAWWTIGGLGVSLATFLGTHVLTLGIAL
jgi:hypothetical protein